MRHPSCEESRTGEDIVALAPTCRYPYGAAPFTQGEDDPQRLHDRYVAGDPDALGCLSSVFLRVLPRRLERAYPRAPWDFAEDAVLDATLEYGANPRRFDPTRCGSILDFAYLVARRNLLNRLHAESSRKAREARFAGETPAFVPDDVQMERSGLDLWRAIVAVTIDSRERHAIELWLDGEGNDAIAQALGLGCVPPDVRRREAKRFKDRMVKRLSRHFGGRSRTRVIGVPTADVEIPPSTRNTPQGGIRGT